MLRGWVLALALLAACGSDHGVYLVIDSPKPLSAVELFIGDQPISTSVCGPFTSTPCMVSPPRMSVTSSVAYPGDVYTQAQEDATYATVSGTRLTYRIDPGANPHTASAILVVGYGAQGVVADKVMYNVPLESNAVQLHVTLDPADTLTGDPTLERVAVWRQPGDTEHQKAACALVRHSDPARDNDYFAPSDDYDCDGALASGTPAECTKTSGLDWCSFSPPNRLDNESCYRQAVDSMACRVGAPPCIDNPDPTVCPQLPNACLAVASPEVACLPMELCSHTQTCATSAAGCQPVLAQTVSLPNIACPAVNPTQLCDTEITDSLVTGTALAGATCMDVQLVVLTPAYKKGKSLTIDGITYTLTDLGRCDEKLTVSGVANVPPLLFADFITMTTLENRLIPLFIGDSTGSCAPAPGTIPCTADGGGSAYVCP